MAKKKSNEGDLLDQLRAITVKRFGDDVLISPDRVVQNEDTISTGIIAFDLVTGGGIPTGRITEVYGDWSTGKTLLCEQWMANVQKCGGVAVWISSEDRLNVQFAEKVGLNIRDSNTFVVFQSRYIEEVYDFMSLTIKLAKEKHPDRYVGIVWDSIAQSDSKQVLEMNCEERSMADNLKRAQVNSAGCRMIAPILPRSKVACLWVNQIREKPGVVYGATTDTTGGRGVKFASSLRIYLRKGKSISSFADPTQEIGHLGTFEVTKSKVCPPSGKIEYRMTYEAGIDMMSGLLQLLVQKGYVKQKTGGWFEADGVSFQSTGPWHAGFDNFVIEHGDWLDNIISQGYLVING